MSFQKRKIDVQFSLDGDTFDGSNNTIKLSGLRVTAHVDSYTGSISSFSSAGQFRVSGMSGSDMAKLSTLGFDATLYKRNVIAVYAGDDSQGMSQIFAGGITFGNVDYNAQPDVGVEIVASALTNPKYGVIAASSYKGSMNVATMLQAIAAAHNPPLKFQNGGVTAVLRDHAVGGTGAYQIRDICIAAGVRYAIENQTLFIWPANGIRDNVIIDLSSDTGLVGYPQYTLKGLSVTSLFNPDIQVGRQVRITTSIPKPTGSLAKQFSPPATGANGTFYVWGVTHQLASESTNGPWFTHIALATSPFNAHPGN